MYWIDLEMKKNGRRGCDWGIAVIVCLWIRNVGFFEWCRLSVSVH